MTEQGNKVLMVIAVMAYAVIVASWTLSAGALDNHECLVSVTAREMLQTGDWILPRFDGEVRLQKTPLCYWLVASVAKLTGKVDEFSSRLPSAFFAILSAAAILYFVSQQLGIRIASLSAAVWISTLAFVRYSHSARPEMTLCSLITISMLSFYSAMQTQSKRHRILYMLVFWLSFALAMLAKGPAPLALVLPPLFFYFLVFRQTKRIKDTLPIIGGILFWLIVLPWPVMVAAKAPGGWAFWKREFIDRFMGEYASGHKPFWYYLPVTFLFAAPFSAFVLYAVAAPFNAVWEKKRPVMWYLWLWFIVQVAVMSVSGGKRQHYILPAFGAFSILAGICLYDMIFELKVFKPKEVKVLFVGHIIALVAASAGLLYWAFAKSRSFTWPAVHIVMILAIAVAIVAFLFARKKKISATVFLFAGYCAIVMAVFVYFLTPLDYNNPSRSFSTAIGKIVPADGELIAYNYISARTIQYAGRTISEIHDLDEVRKKYDSGAWVIASGDDYQDILKTGGFETVLYRQTAERDGSKDTEGALFHKSTAQ
jgi:4-amino-4-deoxy-L-arabinose transferase-like glycosyltransferase